MQLLVDIPDELVAQAGDFWGVARTILNQVEPGSHWDCLEWAYAQFPATPEMTGVKHHRLGVSVRKVDIPTFIGEHWD